MTASVFGGRARRGQAGYLLLEWLIAAALGLAVLAGAVSLYQAQRESFARAADCARMREAGAIALTLVGQQIQMAGYAPLDEPTLRARVTPGVFGCQSSRPVDGSGRAEFVCKNAASDRADSDALIVRYADDGVSTWRSASGEPTDCLGQAVARHGQHAVIVNRFHVAQPTGREEPELYCAGNGHMRTPQPVVEGIDRMELRYWLRGADSPARAGALAAVHWGDVVAVDLCVVVRGLRSSNARGFVDCSGKAVPSPDGRERLALSRHLVLRNGLERRP